VSWLLVTEQPVPEVPPNVTVQVCGFDDLAGFDFWGHNDLDMIFRRIRDHLLAATFKADKIPFSGNSALSQHPGNRPLVPQQRRQGRHRTP
jgi:hypothetical protein